MIEALKDLLNYIPVKEKINSEGKCLFCGKMYAKAGIARHLATHFKKIMSKRNQGNSYFVMVTPDKITNPWPHFLCLWIDGETSMEDFDRFLRNIWLDCCGHESEFEKRQKKFEIRYDLETLLNLPQDEKEKEIKRMIAYKTDKKVFMNQKADEVLQKGIVLDYFYDFDYTTELIIKVIEHYPIKADSGIVLLSRNEPLAIMCGDCGDLPGALVYNDCVQLDNNILCNKCAINHTGKNGADADYTELPVVNSPRIGMCKYTGGKIDVERDGIYRTSL